MTSDSKPDMYYFCADHPFTDPLVSVGGLAMTAATVETVTENLKNLAKGEVLTWDTISQKQQKPASGFISEFCRLLRENKAQLHLRFTSTQQVDVIHKRELSDKVKIAHLYYHLILQRAFRFYGQKYAIHLRPGNTAVEPIFEDMRVRIHKDSFDLFGIKQDPIISLKTASAKDSAINQMLGLALGALTSLRHSSRNTQPPTGLQQTLISDLQANYPMPNLCGNSGAMEQKFSIWNDEPGLDHQGFRGLL